MGAIRLFLAYGVVLGHECDTARNFQITCDAGWTLNVIGGRSVVFFYIVSGFLMSYVLDSKYPRTKAGTYQFYKSRFLRIYPLWWAMVVFSTVTVSAAWLHQSPLGIFSAIFLFGSDWLVPFAHYPDQYFGFFPFRTEIGWTLGAEMTFYLLAPWLLRSDRLAFAALVGSLAVRIVVFFVVEPSSAVAPRIHYLELFFPAVDIRVFHARAFGQARSLYWDCRPVARRLRFSSLPCGLCLGTAGLPPAIGSGSMTMRLPFCSLSRCREFSRRPRITAFRTGSAI